MRYRHTAILICAAFALGALVTSAADDNKDGAKPEPAIIKAGTPSTPDKVGAAPSDAIVLFDGKNHDMWVSGKKDRPVGWKIIDNESMEVTRGTGSIKTKEAYGYGQYHIEFRTPPEVKGNSQGRGNSGVFPMGRNEIQVLDSYDNKTYIDGQCGAVYKQHVPLVNACRPPGVWQTYDIIFHAPQTDKDGKVIRKGAYTVLHNGVLIHDNVEVNAKGLDDKGQLSLQDHGNPVRYRNIWFRPHRKALPRP